MAMTRLLPLLLLPLAAACSRTGPDAAPAEPALPVRVTTATAETLVQTRPLAGTVRPQERAVVSARVMGLVTRSGLGVGLAVNAGDVLVTLEAGEIAARLEQARASLQQAEREFDRESKLGAQGAAAAETVRSAADRLRLARAAVAEAETLLSYTRIAAPFGGVITADHVKPGDLAAPGQPLFALEGTGRLQAEVAVPDSLRALTPGTAVPVVWENQNFVGRLVEASPAADAASRSRLARIDLPAGAPVRSGQFVRVLWPEDEATAITVPAAAVSLFGQMERVFVIDGGRARLRLVKTGAMHDGRRVVLAGLSAGEAVVLDPPAVLRDGRAVEIQP